MSEQKTVEVTEQSLSVGRLFITENNKNWPAETKAKHDEQERSRIYANLREDDAGASAILVGVMANPELAERVVLCLQACEGIDNEKLAYAPVATIVGVGVAQREIAVKALESLRDEYGQNMSGRQLAFIDDAILRARGLKAKEAGDVQ